MYLFFSSPGKATAVALLASFGTAPFLVNAQAEHGDITASKGESEIAQTLWPAPPGWNEASSGEHDDDVTDFDDANGRTSSSWDGQFGSMRKAGDPKIAFPASPDQAGWDEWPAPPGWSDLPPGANETYDENVRQIFDDEPGSESEDDWLSTDGTVVPVDVGQNASELAHERGRRSICEFCLPPPCRASTPTHGFSALDIPPPHDPDASAMHVLTLR